MVTMQQIADKCGVSRGTVDRALHHKEGVREDVAQRIRDTARDMGYLPIRSTAKPVKNGNWALSCILLGLHLSSCSANPFRTFHSEKTSLMSRLRSAQWMIWMCGTSWL